MSKIFIWCSPAGILNDVIGYALAEDGTDLAYHVSSNVSWCKHDMGITSDWHHEEYKKHYPDGFELVWVENPANDERFKTAFALRPQDSPTTRVPDAGESAQ